MFCATCKNVQAPMTHEDRIARRSAVSPVLFIGGFMLLVLATVLFTAYPEMETLMTWGSLYSLYLVYLGLAFMNFRRRLYT